jgi:hypothetical protein
VFLYRFFITDEWEPGVFVLLVPAAAAVVLLLRVSAGGVTRSYLRLGLALIVSGTGPPMLD